MKTPYTLLFNPPPLAVHSKRAKWSKIRFPKAKINKHFVLNNAEINSQIANFFPFYIELIEVNARSDFELDYAVKTPQHFLCLLLKGNQSCFTTEGFYVSHAKQGHLSLTYQTPQTYRVHLTAGLHTAICITINHEWLKYAAENLPHIQAYLNTRNHTFSHLPYCLMDTEVKNLLNDIHSKFSNGIASIDGFLRMQIARILEKYETFISEKQTSLPHLVLNYLNQNYCNPDLNSHKIAAHFNKTERNLRNQFKREFNLTMREYYTHLRIKHATQLIREQNMPISDVFYLVGYNDESTFRYELRKFKPSSP